MGRYDLSTATIGTLLDDPAVRQIIDRHYPGAGTQDAALRGVRGMPAEQGFRLAASYVGQDTVDKVRAEIEAL